MASERGISILDSLSSESIELISLCVPNVSLPEEAISEAGVSVGDMDVPAGVGACDDCWLTQPKTDATTMSASRIYTILI